MNTYDYVIRVSELGDRDELQTVTIPEQHARCRAYITDQLKGRVGTAHDCIDVSGSVVIDSSGYQKALERVGSGRIAGIVVAYSSRFARNAWAVGRYLEQLKRANGELWFVDRPGIDYRTPSGAIIVSVDAVMNDNYLQECKAKAETTIQANIVGRGIHSKCPFGYRRNEDSVAPDTALDAKTLMPDPEKAPVVRRIFERRIDGYSWTAIADELNAAGIASPRGRQWTVATLRGIVGNETYLGVVQYKRRTYRKGKTTGVVVRRDGAHEPLVKRPVWLAAQSAERIQRNGHYSAGVAGGLVRCSGCGGGLVVTGALPHLTYGCRSRHATGRCTAPVHVVRDTVDEMLDANVSARLRGAIATSPASDLARLQASERAALEELEAYIDLASAADRRVFKRGLEARQAAFDAAREAREAEEVCAGLVQELPAADAYTTLSLARRRRVARALVHKVIVHPVCASKRPADRIEILWR